MLESKLMSHQCFLCNSQASKGVLEYVDGNEKKTINIVERPCVT